MIEVYEGKWIVSDNDAFRKRRYFLSQSREFELPKTRWTFQEKGFRNHVNLTILGRISYNLKIFI